MGFLGQAPCTHLLLFPPGWWLPDPALILWRVFADHTFILHYFALPMTSAGSLAWTLSAVNPLCSSVQCCHCGNSLVACHGCGKCAEMHSSLQRLGCPPLALAVPWSPWGLSGLLCCRWVHGQALLSVDHADHGQQTWWASTLPQLMRLMGSSTVL